MSAMKDPFEVSFLDEKGERATASNHRSGASARSPHGVPSAATARLHGFDRDHQPLLTDLADLPGETVVARSTVPLQRAQVGRDVVVAFERGDCRRPIVLGVLQERPPGANASNRRARLVSVEADDDHLLLSADRQITLCCGEASITLTRAGKVIIKGAYVVSRSTGHNKIKGAVVDIN